LAAKPYGLTRNSLLKQTKLKSGAGLTKALEELDQSGFIHTAYPFGDKKKEIVYRLTDEYSLFYIKFIQNKPKRNTNLWKHLSQTQSYKSWSGYAFENICLKHLPQIKDALKIGEIYAEASAFYKKGDKKEKGVQIDLVLDRNDHVVNLFEFKFYNETVSINKAYAASMRQKMQIFRKSTKTKKQLFWTVISTFGVTHNQHSIGLIDTDFNMNILFH